MSGNAFSGSSRIPKDRIESTVLHSRIPSLLGFHGDVEDYYLGSTGKKPDSGDIDLCIDSSTLTPRQTFDTLAPYYGKDIRLFGNIVSVLSPIYGTQDKAQIDLIHGDSTFLKLYYYADPSRSKFNGADRNRMISAITISHRVQTLIDGVVSEEKGPVWTPNGLQFRRKYRTEKRSGGLTKTFSYAPLTNPTPDFITGLELIQQYLFGLEPVFEHDELKTFKIRDGMPRIQYDYLKSVELISDAMEMFMPYDHRCRIWEIFERSRNQEEPT